MESNIQSILTKEITPLRESLLLIETFEAKLYELLDTHPLELPLHVSLALVASAIDLLTHLLNILSSLS